MATRVGTECLVVVAECDFAVTDIAIRVFLRGEFIVYEDEIVSKVPLVST